MFFDNSRFSEIFKVSIRQLLLTTTVLALVFTSWRLAAHIGSQFLIHVIFCEVGAFAGFAFAFFRNQKKKLVISGALAGGAGGSLALLVSMLTVAGGWRIYVSPDTVGIVPWMLAYFIIFWGIVGGIYGGGVGMIIGLLTTLFLGTKPSCKAVQKYQTPSESRVEDGP